MSFTLRKAAGTAVLALAASALTLPLAPAASATTPTETEYFVSDTDGDFAYELWQRTTPNGVATKVAGDATHDISDVSFSRDGSRLAYVQYTLDSFGDSVSSQVVVLDVSGRRVRVVSSLLASSGINFRPGLSPDGNTVVWSTGSAAGIRLYKAGVGTGAASLVSTSYFGAVFLDATTLLAQNVSSPSWATLTLAGAATPNGSLTGSSFDPAVSEDGTQIAWADDTTTTGDATSDLKVASLAVSSGVATIGAPTVIATGTENEAPSFSADGSTVYFTKSDGAGGNGDIWSTPAAGPSSSAAVTVATPNEDDFDVAIGTTDDGTAPGAADASSASVLNGTAATINWTLPIDGDLSGVLITRKLGSTVQKLNVYVPAPVLSYADTGLVIGTTYNYTIQAVDRSGTLGPASTPHFLTALKAAPTFADPTSNTSAKAPFPVTFGPTSSGHWYVDYLPVLYPTWHHWVIGAAGRTRTFGSAATTGVYATTSAPGNNYVFRVQVKDSYGNATGFVSSGRAVVPYDQTKATLYGGVNVSTAAAYLGSYRRLSKTTDYAKVTLVGNRLQVVGWKCTTCGAFAIYDGSTLIATVDTRASSTLTHVVLYTRTYSSVGNHTFTIRPKATAGRPYVLLDGFAMRR
jgi:hypothetical protein